MEQARTQAVGEMTMAALKISGGGKPGKNVMVRGWQGSELPPSAPPLDYAAVMPEEDVTQKMLPEAWNAN